MTGKNELNPTNRTPRTLAEQVSDELRRAIHEGEYEPGDSLPTEQQLRQNFDVSRQTIRAALNTLTQEGLVASGRGRGRVVRDNRPLNWHLTHFENQDRRADDGAGLDAWSAQVKEQGREPREEVAVTITPASQEVAHRLAVDSSTYVVQRQRRRYADDSLYQLSTSYFSEEIARGTPLMEPQSVSAPGGVLAASGYHQYRYVDEILCRMPSAAEMDELGLLEGTPIMQHTRTGYDEEGTPLRVMITIVPGDRHTLIYEVDAR